MTCGRLTRSRFGVPGSRCVGRHFPARRSRSPRDIIKNLQKVEEELREVLIALGLPV